jgi:hypothetical protein
MESSNKLRCTLKEAVEHDYVPAIVREIEESMARQLQKEFDALFLCDPPKSDIKFNGLLDMTDGKSL